MDKTFEIMSMLPMGKENAISSAELTRVLRLKNKRELQLRIARERAAGALILSSTTGGYYTSCNRDEVLEFIRTLENRAKHTFSALKTARKFLKETEFEDQISMGSL